MSTINCSNCDITLNIPPGAKSIRCSVCHSITQLPSFASFGLTPSNQAPPYSEVFGLTPSQSLSQAPPSAAASFGLTPSGSFNYVKPQSGFNQAPPSQNTSAASFGLKPSGSFNYVKPQSGFGGLTPSGSFNYTQQQQQPVFPSLTPSPSFSYGVPGRKKAVIIGVSYKNTRHELKGCINDAKYMKHLLITKFHFREDQIVMFTGPTQRKRLTLYELWTKRKQNPELPQGLGCRVVPINSIIESRDAIFDENIFSSVPRLSLKIPNGTKDNSGLVVPEEEYWVLVDPPSCCKSLGCKWIFKRKLKVDGTVEKFKARLVIQGFRQKLGIDYFDTYAPVARIGSIRVLIAMSSIHNLIIHQMDVKITFLNGELEEEVYMNQPQSFIMPGNKNKVCKLIKSLYGLKQTPKQWHQKFNEVVLSNDYLLNQADKCVYNKFIKSGKGVTICLYVDDMLIFSTEQVQVDMTKEFLPSSTPMDTSEKLMLNNGQTISQLKYSRVIDCLMYAMTCTRPDIAFTVGKLSMYTSNPGTQHWQAIPRGYRVLEGYTDASWINNTEDNSSTSGWVFLLGGGVISWASKKQTCITGLTMEYDCVALAAAGKEAEWLKILLREIPLWSKPITPISIRYDSASTLAKAYSQMYNGK
ncbi:zinc finger, CCHC-type containing protein [Tanacetum coccineum]